MLKVRFVCTKHNTDLEYDDSSKLLIPETNADITKEYTPITKEYTPITLQESTGYFLFDLSECWCEGNKVSDKTIDITYAPPECQDYWRVVIYSE